MKDRPLSPPASPRSSTPAAQGPGQPDTAGADPGAGFPKSSSGPQPFVERRKAQRERRGSSVDAATGLERRRGPGRRLTDFLKAAEEGQMSQEQFLFLMAIDAFKKANNVMYPTWTDVLEVVRLLGYRKTQPSQLKLHNAEDWVESADAPTNVRSKPGHPEAGRREAA